MDQHDYVTLTREGYDRTAGAYVERFQHHLDDKPVDLAMVSAFAGLIAKGKNRRVVDVGCGTGVMTALLDRIGVEVFGIDLSANMVAHARRLNPDLRFSVGSMTDLVLADGSIGGVCAWYSIIHVPDKHLTKVFGEFYRVLVPGGLVLLAFQVGDEPRVLTSAFGRQVHLTFYRRHPGHVAERLAYAGFHVYAQTVRQPDNDGFESTPQAYLIAQKAEQDSGISRKSAVGVAQRSENFGGVGLYVPACVTSFDVLPRQDRVSRGRAQFSASGAHRRSGRPIGYCPWPVRA